ncbi:PH domain-containing protein [Candidatus Saccharibacteria bacterium]|nr:MAG: PH domain-containing protein [Candidatus Saccharibacteria bacterium]
MAKDTQTAVTPKGQTKYFEDQMDDEEVLYVFRKHPIVMRKGLIVGSLGLLVGPLYTLILTYTQPNDPPSMTFFYLSFLGSLALSALLFFPSWMSWHFSVFIVTNERFIQITQKGFFHRSVVDMGLSQIQMVNYQVKGLQETLLGYGTIMMQTFVGDLLIHYIHHPSKTQKRLLEILRTQGVAAAGMPQGQG